MTRTISTDPAASLHWNHRRARKLEKTITFINDADDTPFDISSFTWKLALKRQPSISANILELTSGSGLTVSGNTILISLSAAQTNLSDDVYHYELINETQELTYLAGQMRFFDGTISPASGDATVRVSLDNADLVLRISAPAEDLTQAAVAIVAGPPDILTLDCQNKSQRRFIVTSAIADAFTLALANADQLQVMTLDFSCSAQVAITMPAAFSMQDFEETDLQRWNSATDVLTLAAGRYEMSLTRSGAVFNLKCSSPLI